MLIFPMLHFLHIFLWHAVSETVMSLDNGDIDVTGISLYRNIATIVVVIYLLLVVAISTTGHG